MDLPVGNHFVIPEDELHWSFSTSGGPGGQHANRSATRVELRWELATSRALSDDVRSKLEARLGKRVQDGVVRIVAGESRSQWRNRQNARERLAELLQRALRGRRRRVPTKPSQAAQQARLEAKRRQSAKKRLRGKPEVD